MTVKGLQKRLTFDAHYTSMIQPRIGYLPITPGGNANRTIYQLWLMEACDLLDKKPEKAEQILEEWAARRKEIYLRPGSSDPTYVVIRR
ncbi:MAG: hypothetical protein M3Y49_19165 [Actinomycetota bacterium]|nr:hypothetical protein [Actinomycetota bacterium]